MDVAAAGPSALAVVAATRPASARITTPGITTLTLLSLITAPSLVQISHTKPTRASSRFEARKRAGIGPERSQVCLPYARVLCEQDMARRGETPPMGGARLAGRRSSALAPDPSGTRIVYAGDSLD